MSKTIQEQIDIMQHFANGGQIECKSFGNKEFVSTIVPSWNWDKVDYRIKEQKKTITIEKWLCINEFGDYFTVEIGKNNVGECKKVKLIEYYEVEL